MPEKKIKLLFVDDEEKFLTAMAIRLSLRDFEVISFNNGPDALAEAEVTDFDVALLDLKMPGMDGEELLLKLKERYPDMEIVFLTGHGSIQSAVDLTKHGAFEYLQKPCDFDELISSITSAYAKRIKNKQEAKASKINELLNRAVGLGPLELLNALKKIANE